MKSFVKKLVSFTALFIAAFMLTVSANADTTWVSGTIVNQIWTTANSPYCVDGNILVQGSGLVIQPGVRVVFFGDYSFEVGGMLSAVGTETDSIIFTSSDSLGNWQGIFINYNNSNILELAYCVVELSANSGLRIDNSTPAIHNCTIVNNSSSGYGAGIYTNSSITIEDCVIKNNYCTGRLGGGIYSSGRLTLNRCRIIDNYIYWHGSSETSAGGGIFIDGSYTLLNSCVVSNNTTNSYDAGAYHSTEARGGGIYLVSDTLVLLNTYIKTNMAEAHANTSSEIARGGGVFIASGDVHMENCIISNDSLVSREYWSGSLKQGGGIYIYTGNINIINCSLAYNSCEGIKNISGETFVLNSIVYFNERDEISGTVNVAYSDIQLVQIDSVYPGDGNIAGNPSFYNADSIIIVDGSPCVDAGHPDSIYYDCDDPENPGYALWPALGSVRNDMGSFGGPNGCEEIVGIDDDNANTLPAGFALFPNYPNPFNPQTTIEYALPQPEHVVIDIYDILGRRIEILINASQPAGYHQAIWNGSRYASGIYFYKIQAGDYNQTRKMLMIK